MEDSGRENKNKFWPTRCSHTYKEPIRKPAWPKTKTRSHIPNARYHQHPTPDPNSPQSHNWQSIQLKLALCRALVFLSRLRVAVLSLLICFPFFFSVSVFVFFWTGIEIVEIELRSLPVGPLLNAFFFSLPRNGLISFFRGAWTAATNQGAPLAVIIILLTNLRHKKRRQKATTMGKSRKTIQQVSSKKQNTFWNFFNELGHGFNSILTVRPTWHG